MKRLILIATLIAGSCLNMSGAVDYGVHNHELSEYSNCTIPVYQERDYEDDLTVSGYADFSYVDGNLLVSLENIIERAYDPFFHIVKYTYHDDWIHIMLFTIPLDCSGPYAEKHRTSFSFLIPDVKKGACNIELHTDLNMDGESIIASTFIEEGMKFRKSLDIEYANRILPLDCEWVLCSLEAASPFYRLRTSDNGTTIDGNEYLDILYCEGKEWDDRKAATLAYARVENDALYAVPAQGEFPKNLWHASLEGTLDIHAAQQNETLIYDFTPRFDRQLFVYDALQNRMESVTPVSSKYILKYQPKIGNPTEISLDEAGTQRWLNGVGAVGAVAGPFVYPAYSLDGLSSEGCMRVACLRNIADGNVIYQDDALLSAANITGMESLTLSTDLIHAADGRLYADRNSVAIEIVTPDGTILYAGTLRAGESIDLRRYAPGLTIAKAICGDAIQTLKLL